MDVVAVGSCAYCFQWLWINLAPLDVLQTAYWLISRSPTCLVDDILDLGWHSSTNQRDDQPPLVVVNKVGLPQAALPILLSFLHFHTFQDGNLGIIWDANSSKMEEPNVNEQKWTMGFCTCTTTMWGIFEGLRRQILGLIMDLTYLTWIFSLCWVEKVRFTQFFTPTHPSFTFVAPTSRPTMLVQGGGHPWHLWDRWFMGNGKEVLDVGVLGHFGVTPSST